jgi:hypothetical protein
MVPLLHFESVFALNHSLCSHFAITLDSRKDITDTIFMAMVRNHLPTGEPLLRMDYPPDNNL